MNGATAATELRDLKPLEPYRRQDPGWATSATLILAVLLMAGVAVALWLRNRGAPSPERAATRALASLGTADLPDAAFYQGLTRALRTFLAERFAIPAKTLATSELEQRLGTLPLPEELALGLPDVLRCADRAVYGEQPIAPECRAVHLELVRQFIHLSAPRRRGPVAPP